MNAEISKVERVIGFDSHPDTFTAAVLQGSTPAAAVVQKIFNKLPLSQLQTWAQKHTNAQDMFVLEASGNSFHVVRVLAKVNRKALVLESGHLGKLIAACEQFRLLQCREKENSIVDVRIIGTYLRCLCSLL